MIFEVFFVKQFFQVERLETRAIDTISIIGFDINSPKFERLHQLGARVMAAGNQSELEKNLKALLEADITKLEGL